MERDLPFWEHMHVFTSKSLITNDLIVLLGNSTMLHDWKPYPLSCGRKQMSMHTLLSKWDIFSCFKYGNDITDLLNVMKFTPKDSQIAVSFFVSGLV